jgi:hypothetical protein
MHRDILYRRIDRGPANEMLRCIHSTVASMRRRKCKSCSKLFDPVYDKGHVRQLVCCNSCCAAYYDKQKPKSRRLSREVAKMVGKRSMGEVRFYADNIEGKKNFKADYEPDSFQYTVEETRTYTPDFRIQRKGRADGGTFYIEYKGVLDLETRKKMVRVRDQHPSLDIRFVFQKASNKIRKGSPTSYGDWCDKNGFLWADNKIPKEWLK